MQKLDFQALMRGAKEDGRAIEKLAGDWRTQLQMLNRTVSVVTAYQKAIHANFGVPSGYRRPKNGKFRTWSWYELPEGVVAAEAFRELEDLKFKGTCLVQTLDVIHHAESHAFGTTVKYKAVLKLDENYFLGLMLPQVKELRNADPDYTIYDLTIEVPKGELVAESIRMLNERLGQEPKEPEGPRSPSPFEDLLK